MARAVRETREICDACRHGSPSTLRRVTIEQVEVKICPDTGPCIRRAKVSGLWLLQEAS